MPCGHYTKLTVYMLSCIARLKRVFLTKCSLITPALFTVSREGFSVQTLTSVQPPPRFPPQYISTLPPRNPSGGVLRPSTTAGAEVLRTQPRELSHILGGFSLPFWEVTQQNPVNLKFLKGDSDTSQYFPKMTVEFFSRDFYYYGRLSRCIKIR